MRAAEHARESLPSVGCDIQAVPPVRESMARMGERYVRAVLAPGELAELRARSSAVPPESVAARFAAKEAVLKTLRPSAHDAVAWPHIAVHTEANGAPQLTLTGGAAALAARRNITAWSVSLSHDGDYAMAVTLAAGPTSRVPDASSVNLSDALSAEPPSTFEPNHFRRKEVLFMATAATESTVRQVLSEHGKLGQDAAALEADADLYRAGMTSHASVNVMLALEDEFDIEFPEEMLTKATFTSIQSISEAVESIDHD